MKFWNSIQNKIGSRSFPPKKIHQFPENFAFWNNDQVLRQTYEYRNILLHPINECWGFFPCDKSMNFAFSPRDQLTNFEGVFLLQIDEFCIFPANNWQISWYFLQMISEFLGFFLRQIDKIQDFYLHLTEYSAIDWRISRYFATTNWRMRNIFPWPISKLCSFSPMTN